MQYSVINSFTVFYILIELLLNNVNVIKFFNVIIIRPNAKL